jgi:hypothetical protein
VSENHERVAFNPKSTAPTLDDVFEAFRQKRIMASPHVMSLFEKAISPKSDFDKHIEQFNFGVLSDASLNEAEGEAREFIKHGLFTVPFPMCLYRVSIDFKDGIPPTGVALLIVDGEGDEEYPGHAVVSFTHSPEWMMAMHSVNTLRTVIKDDKVAVEVQVPRKEFAYWQEHVASTTRTDGDITLEDLSYGCRLAMGLTMIINTKGVRKERSAPPEKPNKARAKAGRPLLPWVTRVYTDVYNKAIEPGEGTHASPRPHRRRAHVRTYPATPYRAGYSIPIAAMLVNWDGKPLAERNQYEVHLER